MNKVQVFRRAPDCLIIGHVLYFSIPMNNGTPLAFSHIFNSHMSPIRLTKLLCNSVPTITSQGAIYAENAIHLIVYLTSHLTLNGV